MISFYFEALLFLLNFTGGFSSGKTYTPTVASSSGRIGITRFRLLLRCPKREVTFLCHIFLASGCTNRPYPASTLHSGYGAPNGLNVSLRQGSREECKWDFPMKSSWHPVFQHVILGSFLIIIIIIIIIIIAFKSAIQDFLQSPHRATNCLQHVCSSGQGAIVCKLCTTHRALIICNMSCHAPRGTKEQLSY